MAEQFLGGFISLIVLLLAAAIAGLVTMWGQMRSISERVNSHILHCADRDRQNQERFHTIEDDIREVRRDME